MKKEDQNTEYKQSWREEYLKWICGFANANGGRLVVGVSDDKKGNEVIGVADWKSLLETIPNLMCDTMGMIADGCVYLTGKIETWGRGVKKVMTSVANMVVHPRCSTLVPGTRETYR